MAGTKLVREERVPTVEIAGVAHGDRASPCTLQQCRHVQSVLGPAGPSPPSSCATSRSIGISIACFNVRTLPDTSAARDVASTQAGAEPLGEHQVTSLAGGEMLGIFGTIYPAVQYLANLLPIHRFAQVVVHAGGPALGAVLRHRVSSQSNDG